MPDDEGNQEALRPQPPGLGLGERLRSARKARALSVAQVAENLRLEEASVLALEDGRFDAMGAPVFVRGHLKRYAQLVGLAPETVLEAYRAAAPGSDAPPSLARPREQSDTVRMSPWVYWIAAAVLLVGVIIALSGRHKERGSPAVAPTSVVAPATVPVPETAPGGSSPAADASGAATAAETPPAAGPVPVPTNGAATENRP